MTNSARRSTIFFCLALFALGFVVYLPALQNGFAFDDLIHITSNPLLLEDFSWRRIFMSAMYPGDLYRPFVVLTYALTNKYFGLGAYNFHFDNNLLHAANSLLVFAVFRSLVGSSAALWAGVLFALNPIACEAVANVSGRSELLSTFFVLASLFVLQLLSVPAWNPRHVFLLPLLALTAMGAVLSKESALVLVLLAPLALAWRSMERLKSPGAIAGICVLIITSLTYLWLRFVVLGISVTIPGSADMLLDNPLSGMTFVERLPLALSLLGFYARKVFVAAPLSADYSYAALDPNNFWAPFGLLYLSIFVLLLIVVVRRRGNRDIKLGVLWFFTALFIASNVLFPIGTIFAERLAYLPSIGLLVAFAACCEQLLSAGGLKFVGGVVAVLFSLQTIQHQPVWASNESLFSYQITVSPSSAKTANNFGVLLRNQGKLDDAFIAFRRAHEIFPAYADPAFGLASLYARKGALAGAEHWLNEALRIDAAHVESLNLLGRLQLNRGDSAEAGKNFAKALERRPDFFEAKLGLLAVAVQSKDIETAKQLRDKLIKLAPTNPEFMKLSVALDGMTNAAE